MQILVRCTFENMAMTQKSFPEGIGQALRLENTAGGRKVLEELLNAHKGLLLSEDELGN